MDGVNFAKGPVVEIDTEAADWLTDLQMDCFKFVKKNYKDPFYVALWPNGLTDAKKLSGTAAVAEIKRICEYLKDLPKDHPLHSACDKGVALQKAYVEPVKGLAAAQTAEAKAWTQRNQARQAWLLAYEAAYGGLRAMFPGRRSFVESFFVRFSKASAGGTAPVAGETALEGADETV